MGQFLPLFKREFLGYFRSPVAYVFIVVFLLTSVGSMFFIAHFYESDQSSLEMFFIYHPWLYLVLVPAVGMRLWAEERKSGSLELLFTLPVTMQEAVLAKFFAGWGFLAIALALTFPVVLTVNYLGQPDNGVILTGYLGSLLMAGAYLSVTCFTSSLTKNQVVSFILSVIICFVLVLLSWGVFTHSLTGVFPVWFVDIINSIGFMTHFQTMMRGLLDVRDIVYFFSVIVVALSLNTLVLDNLRK